MMLKVGITGGIGSGKSTVCRLFSMLGIPVYDTDSRAKVLMGEDPLLIQEIIELLGQRSYVDGKLDRSYVSEKVFTDKTLLERLNSIVHPAVGRDFLKWVEQHCDAPYVIMECAILFESGFAAMVNKIVTVTAPEDIRVRRTCKRDGVDEQKVKARIANQMTDRERMALSDYQIRCDEKHLVWPQALELDKKFKNL